MAGLKHGKKKVMEASLVEAIWSGLCAWREELSEELFPGTVSIAPEAILGDNIIEKLAGCGERASTYAELRLHA